MPEWKVPGYTELKALGSGGFGDVVLARHDTSGTLVAIKYLHPDLLADPEFARMFRDEATMLASLEDPNVVRLYEYVESSAGAAIVMELVSGVSLREILTYQGKTSAEAALVVLQGSLLGLAAAHRRGVVHRDYKPENVLVNGDGISKLTDFGIAARTGDRPIPAGTVAYAAPEQMAGASASPASDVYAATATFYECLTGHPPFRGDTAADLLRQHRAEPVPLDPIPGPLRPLVAAGMAKDPGRRPVNATTFVTELNTAAPGAYGRHWADRGRSHLGEAALLLAVLWPSGAPPTVQGTTVHRIRLHRRVKPRRISPAGAAIAVSAAIAVVAASMLLAAAATHRPSTLSRPAAVVQAVSLQPSPSRPSPNTGLATPPSPNTGPATPPSPNTGRDTSPSRTQTSHPGHPGTSVPAAPSNLTVTAVDPNDIQLDWQVNSSDQTGFEISNGVVSANAGAGSTSYTWGGLSPGTYMCFRIRAYNSAGDSAWDPDVSPWYTCTTTPTSSGSGTSAPAAPSNLTVTAVDPNDIQLDWQVNSSDQTGFEISNGVVSANAGAGSTSYTWGGLSPGTYMCFRIRAYNSAGDSAWDPDVSPWYTCTTTPTSGGVG